MGKKDQNKPQRVKPQLLKGFRDYPPDQQAAREKMIARLQQAVELLGFQPLQTASVESADVLLGSHYSPDSLSELFGFKGPDDADMALRYEFTLSLARYVASQPDLPLPFRRYQYGNVWRVDKPGPGRYREFMQFDIDIVGTRNMLADAEIIAAMVGTMERLGIERFEVRYSNRKILNGLVAWAGIPSERGPEVMRVLDKFEKQGEQSVIMELGKGRVDESGADIAGLGLAHDQVSKVSEFLHDALARNADNPLAWAESRLKGIAEADQGMAELLTVDSHLQNMGISREKARIDLTIVRGLGYYTGTVFETYLKDLTNYGSMFSGGRYDNLVERFQSLSVPGVGSSIGVDRLLAALLELKKIPLLRSTSRVLVTVMDQSRLPDYLTMLKELRAAGIASEIFSGDTKNLTRQIRYADKLAIPLVVIAGTNEFDAGLIRIKNLAAGASKAGDTSDREDWLKAEGFQEDIPRGQLVSRIKQLLGLE